MELKILGSILCVLSSSGLGFWFGMNKKKRMNELKELKKLFTQLKGEIQYHFMPLPEAMERIGTENETIFSEFFLEIAEKLKGYEGNTFYQIWKEAIGIKLSGSSLNRNDQEKLLRIGETMGHFHQELEIKSIENYLLELEQEIQAENKVIEEKVRLCRTLGVLGGLFLSIIMV